MANEDPIYFEPQTTETKTETNNDVPIYFQNQSGEQSSNIEPTIQPQQQIISQNPATNTTELKAGNTNQKTPLLSGYDSVFDNSPKDGDGCCNKSHLLSWVLCLLFWGFTGFGILGLVGLYGVVEGIWPVIVMIVLYIVYIIECFCSSTMKYLNNIYLKEQLAEYINRIQSYPPRITWNISCYHWETRRERHTYTDSNGNQRTEWKTRQEKVYTHHANGDYNYKSWKDVSLPLFDTLEQYQLTQLTLMKAYEFANIATQQHYNLLKDAFILRNNRDTHYDFSENLQINEFTTKILAECAPGVKPAWISNAYFIIASIFGCSPCFRNAFSAKCGSKDYIINKQVSC